MRNWKRLFYYLLINVLVSSCATVAVLTIWDRARPPQVADPESIAQNPGDLNPVDGEAASAGKNSATQNPQVVPAVVEATPTQEPDSGPARKKIEYAVQSGDTLGKIADRFDITIEDIIAANEMEDPNRLDIGQILIIPGQPEPTPEVADQEPTKAPPVSTGGAPVVSGDAGVNIDSVVGAGDLNTERLLLKRTGPGELSLAGWQLLEEDGAVFTFPKLTLFEDGAVNVHTGSGQPTVVDLYWSLNAPVWQSGETVVLLDDRGEVRATYRVP
jgi:LysM repeat protein